MPTVTGWIRGALSLPRTVARSAAPSARSRCAAPLAAISGAAAAKSDQEAFRSVVMRRILASAGLWYRRAMPGVHELRIALTVDDFDAAVAFYRDALGLEVRDAWNRSNGRGMILEAGRATLELFDQQQAETLDAIEVGRRASGTIRFAIHVDDAGAAAEELVEAGATLEAAAAVTP